MHIKLMAVALMAGLSFGCLTPAGYDRDTTPGDNGEGWVGAASISAVSGHDQPGVRQAMATHLQLFPVCAWCGTGKDLVAHHVIPVHIDATLAANPANLLTLCKRCHFVIGHKCDWRRFVALAPVVCAMREGPK